MKKVLYLVIVLSLVVALPLGAGAFSLFGSDDPTGAAVIDFGVIKTDAGKYKQVKLFVKDGVVFDKDQFVYDPVSHILAKSNYADPASPGAPELKPTRKSKTRIKDKTAAGGVLMLLDAGTERSVLESIARQPDRWQQYLNVGGCADERELRAGLGLPKQMESVLADKCSGLKTQVGELLFSLRVSGTIIGGGTERGRILQNNGLLPKIQMPFEPAQATAVIKKANDPATIASIKKVLADYPPEDEIIPLTTKTERGESWSEPSIYRHPVMHESAVTVWLSGLAFNDEVLVSQFRRFDYYLGSDVSTRREAYADSSAEVLVDGKRKGFMDRATIPRYMYAWHIPQTAIGDLTLPVPNVIDGPGGLGKYFAFPFLDVGATGYRTAWLTWYDMLHSMTDTEIRKLVLLGDVVRGAALDSPWRGQHVRPEMDRKAALADRTEYPSLMSWFAADAVAPWNMRSINMPSEWDVANPLTKYTDGSQPGLTVGRWYAAVLAAGGEGVNSNPDFQSFTKALFAGDAATAKAIVNRAVSDAALTKVQAETRARVAKLNFDDKTKVGLVEAIQINPTAIYRHLGEVLQVRFGSAMVTP